MKKKLLSVLLLCAMVITLLPAAQVKADGLAYIYNKKKPSTMLTTKKYTYLYVGGARVNMDYNIGGKMSGISGKWTSSNTNAVTVDKYGICKAVGNGTATITYTYKQKGTTKKIQCRVKALTRATGITLAPSTSGFDGSMVINSAASFTASLVTNPKAIAVNPDAKTTYGIYYNLYSDADCTVPASESIATVNSAGLVVAKAPGKVYLRATGKNSPNATAYNVNSVAIPITIKSATTVVQTDSNKFKITANEEIVTAIVRNPNGVTINSTIKISDDKRSAELTVSVSPMKGDYTVVVNGTDSYKIACEEAVPTRIELASNYAILDKSFADAKGYPKAYIYFTLYDQFGNDITNSPAYPANRFLGIWDAVGTAEVKEQGVAVLDFKDANVTTPVVGTPYTIKIYYGGNAQIQISATVTLGEPATVKSLDFAGIYTYVNLIEGYKKMASADLNNMITGTTIVPYANSTTTVGAYYMLVSAKDQYGNSIARSGVAQSTVSTYLNPGKTNLALATTESIDCITIDGVKYLAYPLTAGTGGKLANGTATLILSGGTAVPKTVTLKIAETAGISGFSIRGTAYIKKVGTSYTPLEGYVDYVVTNTAGNIITDFDTLVTLTGATQAGNTGMAYIYNDAMVYSPNGSIFRWEKQPNGTAKLYYLPTVATLLTGGSMNVVGVDTITTLKGTSNESTNNSIIVYVQE